jgi:uncharacterized OB-fold protein
VQGLRFRRLSAPRRLSGVRGPGIRPDEACRRGQEDQAPYAVGIAELDDGVRLTAQVVDCDFADLKVGLRVRLEFRKLSEDGEAGVIYYGYKFVPE